MAEIPGRTSFDLENPFLAGWLDKQSLELSGQVSQTTIDNLSDTLRDGIRAGEGMPDLTKRVRGTFTDASRSRANLIARTEANKAANGASWTQATNSGVVKTKTWISASDSRVRPEHRILHGETVPLDKPFSNGLMFPSQPRCRCTLSYGIDSKLAGEAMSPREERFASRGFEPATAEDRKRLSIPPAWREVQIDRSPGARLLAVGVDNKGREQRIYSALHHEQQAAAKFARIGALHERLPAIDRRIAADAARDDTALSALLIRRMGLRPGSDAFTGAAKKAYGATNLKVSHIEIDGDKIYARFTGKKGVALDLQAEDPELAKLLKGRQAGKGAEDRLLDTDERKLRDYMKKAAPGVKPKDFRTYLGTSEAKRLVDTMPVPKNAKEYKAQRREVGTGVSRTLGNTPSVALESYISPAVFGPWDSALAGVVK